MGLLWRKGAKVWRGKGYSHTTAADTIEGKFGSNRGLGRSRIAVLVTTQKEEVPPDVAKFILDEMRILDEEMWAEYLCEEKREPPEETGSVPGVNSEPGDVREVARGVAAEVAETVKGRLDAFGTKFEAFISMVGGKLDVFASSLRGTLEAFTSSAQGKLDTAQASLNHADARLELLEIKLDHTEAKRDKDKREIIRAVWRAAGFAAVVAVVAVRWTVPVAANPAQVIVNVGPGAVEEAARAQQGYPRVLLGPIAGAADMGKQVPEENLIPSAPLPNQKVPPCDGRLGEEPVSGGCWAAQARVKPPCGLLYRKGNECYRPIAADPSVPVGDMLRAPGQELR